MAGDLRMLQAFKAVPPLLLLAFTSAPYSNKRFHCLVVHVDDGKHQRGPAVLVSLVNVRALMDQFLYSLSVSIERRSHQRCVAMIPPALAHPHFEKEQSVWTCDYSLNGAFSK